MTYSQQCSLVLSTLTVLSLVSCNKAQESAVPVELRATWVDAKNSNIVVVLEEKSVVYQGQREPLLHCRSAEEVENAIGRKLILKPSVLSTSRHTFVLGPLGEMALLQVFERAEEAREIQNVLVKRQVDRFVRADSLGQETETAKVGPPEEQVLRDARDEVGRSIAAYKRISAPFKPLAGLSVKRIEVDKFERDRAVAVVVVDGAAPHGMNWHECSASYYLATGFWKLNAIECRFDR